MQITQQMKLQQAHNTTQVILMKQIIAMCDIFIEEKGDLDLGTSSVIYSLQAVLFKKNNKEIRLYNLPGPFQFYQTDSKNYFNVVSVISHYMQISFQPCISSLGLPFKVPQIWVPQSVSRAMLPLKALGKDPSGSFFASFQLLVTPSNPQCSLACSCITPSSASKFT